jgi:excinuclease ABC subunit B
VAILDADKEGFLRSETSLMQTIGRSARNVDARVILYADTVTESMQQAIDETRRRRALQEAYNVAHGITPETIRKEIRAGIESESASRTVAFQAVGQGEENEQRTAELMEQLEADMMQAAAELDFERAASIRDRIDDLRTGGRGAGGRGGGRRGKRPSGGTAQGRIPRPNR